MVPYSMQKLQLRWRCVLLNSPPKSIRNLRFSGVYREYRKGPLPSDGWWPASLLKMSLFHRCFYQKWNIGRKWINVTGLVLQLIFNNVFIIYLYSFVFHGMFSKYRNRFFLLVKSVIFEFVYCSFELLINLLFSYCQRKTELWN